MFLSFHVRFQRESTLYSCLNIKELLVRNRRDVWSLSGCNWTQTHNHSVRKQTLNRLAKLAKFINDWAVLWVLICTVHLTVCSYHVTYAFQIESTFYSCLNVKELLAQNRRDIWSLSDCNGTRSHSYSFRKRALNHLAKLVTET